MSSGVLYPTKPAGPPSGAAGGDLGGTYPNPATVKLAGVTPSAFFLTLVDDVDAAAAKATLGVVAGGAASHMPSDLVTVLASGTAGQYERHPRTPSVVQLAARPFQTQADSKAVPPQTWTLGNSGALASASVASGVLTLTGASSNYDCYGGTDTGPRLERSIVLPTDYELVGRIGLANTATGTHRIDFGLYYGPGLVHLAADLVCTAGVWLLRSITNSTVLATAVVPTVGQALAGIWVRLRLKNNYTWTMDYHLGGGDTEPTSGWVPGASGTSGTINRQPTIVEHISLTRDTAGSPVATITGVRSTASAVDVISGGPGLAGEGYAAAPAAILLADIDAGSGATFAPNQANMRLRLTDAINRLPGDAGTWTFSCVSSASPAPAAGAYAAAASVVSPAAARYVRLYALCTSTSGTQPASIDLSRLVLT